MATWKFKEMETFDYEVDFLLTGFCVVLTLLMLQAVEKAKKRDRAARWGGTGTPSTFPFSILCSLSCFPDVLIWGGEKRMLSRKDSRNTFSSWVYLKDNNVFSCYPGHSFGAGSLGRRDAGAEGSSLGL